MSFELHCSIDKKFLTVIIGQFQFDTRNSVKMFQYIFLDGFRLFRTNRNLTSFI